MNRDQFIQDIDTLIDLQGTVPTKYCRVMLALMKNDAEYFKKIIEKAQETGVNLRYKAGALKGLAENALAFKPWEDED